MNGAAEGGSSEPSGAIDASADTEKHTSDVNDRPTFYRASRLRRSEIFRNLRHRAPHSILAFAMADFKTCKPVCRIKAVLELRVPEDTVSVVAHTLTAAHTSHPLFGECCCVSECDRLIGKRSGIGAHIRVVVDPPLPISDTLLMSHDRTHEDFAIPQADVLFLADRPHLLDWL